jgi:hypothetical protein
MSDGRILLRLGNCWRIAKTASDVEKKKKLLIRDVKLGVNLNVS